MAVRGLNHQIPATSRALLVGGFAAAILSLAAALAGLLQDDNKSSAPQIDEVAARNERIAFFEKRAATDSIDYVSLNILAAEYLQRARDTGDVSDYGRANVAASRSLEILPEVNYGGLVSMASVNLVQHNFTGALALSDRATALKPWEAQGYGVRADALIGLGRYREAEETLGEMVSKAGTLPALSRLAHLAFLKGDMLNAEDFWRQALSRAQGLPRENLAWAHVQLGGFYTSTGELDNARKQYSQALLIFPGYHLAESGLAGLAASKGHWQESIDRYEQAQARLPQMANIIALADVYLSAGQKERAAHQLELIEVVGKIYRANGVNSELQLSLFYSDHGIELDNALSMARAAYDTSPSVYAADALAWALFKNGRLNEAAQRMTEALALATPEASFHYHAAQIGQARGDREQALMSIEKALDLNPHFSISQADDAETLLARLKGSL